MRRVLVVEDEPVIRSELARVLAEHDFEVATAQTVSEAEAHQPEAFDLILTDLRLPGPTGDTLIDRAPDVPVIVMTAYGTVTSAVNAMKRGAIDYLSKPFDPDELVLTVRRALKERHPNAEARPRRDDGAPNWSVEGMVGECQAMQAVFRRIEKVAKTDAKVLILGESGTGKELVARALHAQSLRSRESFVAVNCASIPDGLIESELFGHERGAFTGAVKHHEGLIRAADGGTLFLDEIGELPLLAQARLLRVLQENEVRKVGSSRRQQVNVRLIAATHRDLQAMVSEGTFREDLYFRLRVFEIELPPLRERGEDIIRLATAMLARFAAAHHKGSLEFAAGALDAIQAHNWPGNARELQNAVERAVILHDMGFVTREMLGLEAGTAGSVSASVPGPAPLSVDMDGDVSLDGYFRAFVRSHEADMSETELAKTLGISRKTLWERRNRLGVPRAKRPKPQ